MSDCKLEEVVNKVIKFHRAETWKDKTQWNTEQTNFSTTMNAFLKTPRKTDHFSLCSSCIGNSFLFTVSKAHNYTSPIMSVQTTSSLMALEDPVATLPRSARTIFTLSAPAYLSLLLRTYTETLGYWSWCVCSTESLKSLGVYSPLSMTDLLKSMQHQLPCPELGPALELKLYSRALQDQGVAIFCGTLPEITSLLDFLPSLFCFFY